MMGPPELKSRPSAAIFYGMNMNRNSSATHTSARRRPEAPTKELIIHFLLAQDAAAAS